MELDEHSEDADAALAELWQRYVTDRSPELSDRIRSAASAACDADVGARRICAATDRNS